MQTPLCKQAAWVLAGLLLTHLPHSHWGSEMWHIVSSIHAGMMELKKWRMGQEFRPPPKSHYNWELVWHEEMGGDYFHPEGPTPCPSCNTEPDLPCKPGREIPVDACKPLST
eukprot:TRINITY_DN47827_c0_g1_i2.p1 TRINITY_DN47827_c0_g1~~TRINITY_DN47827_c0_g1_i2.p1  ORF type:complete len:112 (+),score=6.82 TRINITY_DN47827_c0_g1_i2:30-365(+)